MRKIYNKKQIYNALDIDINLRDGGSMNPKSMTGLIDNIIVNSDSSDSSDTSILFDIFGGQQPYYRVLDGGSTVLAPLTADKIPELIKDGGQHDIFYEESPTTYCASMLWGTIHMEDANKFTEDQESGYWYYSAIA